MSRIPRRGASLVAVVVTLVFFLIGARAAWFAMSAPVSTTGPVTELRTALIRAGLGADSLAAAGLTAQETTSVVGAFATAMADAPGALEQADADYTEARVAQDALQRKVACYLPVLQPLRRGHLHFVRYRDQERTRRNRFGIAEPRLKPGNIADPWTLDIIFLPLVAFDREGNRLGMGGGYYDRTLASLRQRTRRRPRLIGLAYSSQEVPSLTPSPWDVGMDAVVTEKALIRFERSPTN